MRTLCFTSCVILSLMGVAAAQQVNNSTSANASTNSSVSASRSGANVQSDNQANASSQTSVTTPAARSDRPTKNNHRDHRASKQRNNNSADASNNLAAGTVIDAVLAKPLDSRKAKPGDPVMATASQNVTSNGKVVVRKGSKLIGHVTEAKAKGKGEANSALGIAFDKAVLKNGQQVELNSVVQAIAAARGPIASPVDDDGFASAPPMGGGAAPSGGGLLGGATSTVSSTTGAVAGVGGNATGAVGSTLGSTANVGNGVNGTLGSATTGVVGLKGLSLASDATNATEGSVITSTGKSVHLDSGTQLLLRVTEPADTTSKR